MYNCVLVFVRTSLREITNKSIICALFACFHKSDAFYIPKNIRHKYEMDYIFVNCTKQQLYSIHFRAQLLQIFIGIYVMPTIVIIACLKELISVKNISKIFINIQAASVSLQIQTFCDIYFTIIKIAY